MSYLNLEDYYSKISQIRAKIISQHQPQPPPKFNSSLPKTKQIYQTADYSIPQTKSRQKLPPYLRPHTHSQPKLPLSNPVVLPRPTPVPTGGSNKASVVEERVDVNARLKELQNVNDKIKNMLASKRSSIVSGESKISAKHEQPAQTGPASRWERPQESAIERKWERSEENKRVGALFRQPSQSTQQEGPIITPISSHYTPPPPSTFAKQLPLHEKSPRDRLEKSGRNTSREVERLEQLAKSRKEVHQALQRSLKRPNKELERLEQLGNSRKEEIKALEKAVKKPAIEHQQPASERRPALNSSVKRRDELPTPTKEDRVQRNKAIAAYDRAWLLSNSQRPQVGKIVRALVAQTELDGELRGLRSQFSYWKAEDKWHKLKDALARTGCSIPEDELHSWMDISKQQHDPFAAVAQSDQVSMAKVLAALVEARRHWEGSVRECASIQGLAGEHFGVGELDIAGKGFISTDDLTCFLNMNSIAQLRSRDLAPMMRRFNRMEGVVALTPQVSYSVFLDYLTR